MDEQIVTYAVGLGVVVVLAISYLRYRSRGEEDSQPSVSIRETLAEARSYFGADPKTEDESMVKAFDLAPMKMLSDLVRPTRGKESTRTDKK